MTFEDATSFQDRRTCLPVLRRRTWSPWPRRRGSCSRWAGTPHTASPPPSTWVRFLNTSPFRNAKSIEINQSIIPGNARPYCRDVYVSRDARESGMRSIIEIFPHFKSEVLQGENIHMQAVKGTKKDNRKVLFESIFD